MSQHDELLLTKEEQRLLEVLRTVPFGDVTVRTENAQPLEISELRRSTMLL